ncbi:MAG TPA: M28 family peptidase [Geobacterales bacterium]|nr:M28 family peptidase [Geobacterales bacterium]
MLDIIKHLSLEIGPRGAGTINEKRSAAYIAEQFNKEGLKVEEQEFHTIPTFSYPYIIIYTLLTAAVLLRLFQEMLISIALAIISFIFYLLEEELYWPVLTKFLCIFGPKSRNVIGKFNIGKDKKIAIIAHYDSTKASYIFNPRRVGSLALTIKLNFVASMAILILISASFFINIVEYLALTACIPLIVSLLVLIHRELYHDYVPGANDNASGVAVLISLTKELKNIKNKEIWFIATGSEEAGMIGMYNILGKLRNYHIINIDNVGAGKIYVTKEEGIVIKYRPKGKLYKIASEISSQYGIGQISYTLLPTDATPAMCRSLDCITIIALGEKGIPVNYHWYNDTYEHINENNLEIVKKFVIEIVNRI